MRANHNLRAIHPKCSRGCTSGHRERCDKTIDPVRRLGEGLLLVEDQDGAGEIGGRALRLAQLRGDGAAVKKHLALWIKRYGRTAQVKEIQEPSQSQKTEPCVEKNLGSGIRTTCPKNKELIGKPENVEKGCIKAGQPPLPGMEDLPTCAKVRESL